MRSWGPRGGKLATTPTLCRRAARAALDSHELFMTLLRLDTRFAMTPSASSRSRRNSNRVLRPKPEKPFADGFEAQTTKPPGEVYPLRLLHDLNMCHRRPRPPNHQVLLRLRLTWSTPSTPPHVLLLVGVPKCQLPTVSLPAILVPRSKPHVRSLSLLVHRYDTSLLDLLHAH